LKSSLNILIVFLLLFASSCEEATEGCLDPKANNFDVTVREECCCEYPVLKFTLSHRYGDDRLILGEDYLNARSQSFQVISVQHFISDIQVANESGWLSILDSLPVFTPDGGDLVLIDDPIRVVPNTFTYDVGTFLTDGDFQQVRFTTGIEAPAIYYESDEEGEEHPLQQSGSALYDESEGYLDFSITLRNPQGDTLIVSRPATVAVAAQVLDIVATKDKGEDLELVMQIDYQTWLTDIDFASDSLGQMAARITAGKAGSFTVVP